MLALYVVCLVLGGALVALSVFGGGETDLDVGAAMDVDLATDIDAPDADVAGEGVAAAAHYLSGAISSSSRPSSG